MQFALVSVYQSEWKVCAISFCYIPCESQKHHNCVKKLQAQKKHMPTTKTAKKHTVTQFMKVSSKYIINNVKNASYLVWFSQIDLYFNLLPVCPISLHVNGFYESHRNN